ncbi:hypothetical protein M011DRAFT_164308 [Sporormia fimetaria CBS 119925]|uniref:Uncharacterized protein n=1 Tax=Sporormia fimetaria CBS 119925 TaxID=1340428 RepID=A0A6A6V2I8_9PLEO|nr:hypothetical protein M011DRAFT_164308 [Sporormia fimetaria CBS 119925]
MCTVLGRFSVLYVSSLLCNSPLFFPLFPTPCPSSVRSLVLLHGTCFRSIPCSKSSFQGCVDPESVLRRNVEPVEASPSLFTSGRSDGVRNGAMVGLRLYFGLPRPHSARRRSHCVCLK